MVVIEAIASLACFVIPKLNVSLKTENKVTSYRTSLSKLGMINEFWGVTNDSDVESSVFVTMSLYVMPEALCLSHVALSECPIPKSVRVKFVGVAGISDTFNATVAISLINCSM